MGFLSGKRILITGVASKLSIAYGIAQAMHKQGAELAFTYQNDKLKGRVEEFAKELGSDIVLPCDVAEDESIKALFTELAKPGLNLTVSFTLSASPGRSAGWRLCERRHPRRFQNRARHQRLQLCGDGERVPCDAEPELSAADPVLRAQSARSRTTTSWVWRKRLWKRTYATWRTRWVRKACASTPFPPVRSVPRRRPASRTSVKCWRTVKRLRRSVAP